MKPDSFLRSHRCITILLLCTLFLAVAASGEVFAEDTLLYREETADWEHPAHMSVPDRDLAFTSRTFRHPKNDSIYFMCRFNDGWVFMSNLFHYRGGLLDRWGIYALVTDPEGRSYWYTHEMDASEVVIREDYLYVSDGHNTVQGNKGAYVVQYDFEGFSCNLFFTNRLNPWRAGNGILYFDKRQEIFEHRVVNSPWADVNGKMHIEGKTVDVAGQGYSEKSLTVAPISKTQPYMHALRVFSKPGTPEQKRWYLSILDFVTHESMDSKRYSRLFMGNNSEWVLATPHYTIELGDFIEEEGLPYTYPRTFTVTAETQGYFLEAEFESRVLFDFTDILSELPKVVKTFILLFIDRPVFFRMLGTLEGTLVCPDGEIVHLSLSGAYEYVVVK